MYAEDGVVLGIDNHLAKARFAFVLRHKATAKSHRQFLYLHRDRHRLRLCFRDTYGRDLRVRINDRRDSIIRDALQRDLLQHASYCHFGLTRSNMREHDLSRDISAGIDIRQVSLAELIDLDRSALQLDVIECLESQQIRTATDRNQYPLRGKPTPVPSLKGRA